MHTAKTLSYNFGQSQSYKNFFILTNLSRKRKKYIVLLLPFFTLLVSVIWKSRHGHLGISIGIDVGIGIGIVNIFLLFEALLFAFRSFLLSKTSMLKFFSKTLASFPESVCCCSEQLFCRDVVAPASEERNSAMYVISGVLKTRKAESCSLYVCVFLIRNHIRDHFLEVFCKFQNTFKKFG